MLFIKSKIQFSESKSQLLGIFAPVTRSCLSSQRYNFLKANHNLICLLTTEAIVVYQVKDTIFWKQITTGERCSPFFIRCLSSQRYNFLKANHNWGWSDTCWNKLFIKSKIQFSESKSQLMLQLPYKTQSCLSSQRYNFLKANHNCSFFY